MPGPDPEGVYFEFTNNGGIEAFAEIWPWGNRRFRESRMNAVLQKLRSDNWSCRTCGGPVPIYRRADACYCRESCRKGAARQRRKK